MKLTPKQTAVVELLAEGKTYDQIAEELHISLNTVKSHTSSVRRILGTHHRADTVAVAMREGLVA